MVQIGDDNGYYVFFAKINTTEFYQMSEPYLDQTTHSLIPIDDADPNSSWQTIKDATKGLLTVAGEKLLRQGLANDVKSVLVEESYVCKDYRSLFSYYYSKKFSRLDSRCSRLHFFDSDQLTLEDVVNKPEECQCHYMGFSVVEPTNPLCLGRTVISPKSLSYLDKSVFALTAKFVTRIRGAEYHVHGFPYRMQCDEATVCAHTALWAVCRHLSQRYTVYGELLPHQLVDSASTSRGRKAPNHGLTYSDYCEIISMFGCFPVVVVPNKKSSDPWTLDPEAFYDIYAYMESGIPILASFNGHVMPIIGHSIADTPRKDHLQIDPKYLNSAAFLDSYIVSDDNYFPNQHLKYSGKPQYYGSGYPELKPCIDSIFAVVVPLPEKAYLSAGDARKESLRVLRHKESKKAFDEVRNRLSDKTGPVVYRQFLTSGAAFKEKKRKHYLASGDMLAKFPITLNLPHFVWVFEILTTNLAKKQLAMGEVIWDATSSRNEMKPIYIRIGRSLVVADQINSYAEDTFPQFVHNLGQC